MRGVVFTDVDGTLTLTRSTTELDLEAVRWLKLLRAAGYAVVLVSGNSIPVLVGLSTYLGLGNAAIAENGCVIYAGKAGLKPLCSEAVAKELSRVAEEVVARSKGVLRESWQNAFRFCDRAFKWQGIDGGRAVELLTLIFSDIAGGSLVKEFSIESSGYAIHVHAKACDKGLGIRELIRIMGWGELKTYCVGDSATDVSMRRACEYLVAVSNSDNELKEVADYVTSKPSSKGFIEFARMLLANNLPRAVTR